LPATDTLRTCNKQHSATDVTWCQKSAAKMASLHNLRTPDALKLTSGNVAEKWKRFKEQFAAYELAAVFLT